MLNRPEAESRSVQRRERATGLHLVTIHGTGGPCPGFPRIEEITDRPCDLAHTRWSPHQEPVPEPHGSGMLLGKLGARVGVRPGGSLSALRVLEPVVR